MRILHMIPDIGISNGVMSVILNYANAMPDDIKFDVLYFEEKEKTKEADIISLGGNVYKINPPSVNTTLQGEIFKLLKLHKGEWSALHIHAPHFAVFIAPYARICGIKKICIHCHSTWYSLFEKNIKRNKLLFELGLPFVDKKFACGRDAGLFWYKKSSRFEVLNNAVDCSKYRYSEVTRNTKRTDMSLSNELVIGHIGRADSSQKNQPFLIKVFSEILKFNPNSVLLLAGAETNDELCSVCNEYGVSDNVEFLGLRNDIPELLQAFDVFVFPSIKEGLPVAVIEAQAAGVPVLMSDSITDEVVVTDSVRTLSLNSPVKEWTDNILELSHYKHIDNYAKMCALSWDINSAAKKLIDYYRR